MQPTRTTRRPSVAAGLAAAVVALVMAMRPASAAEIPDPTNVPTLPDVGHTLSAKKKCTKKQRKRTPKNCKRKARPTPSSTTAQSRHWFRDVNGDGTMELTFDTDGDGYFEGVFYDFEQDGYYDVFETSSAYGRARAFDLNKDTYYEVILLDAASDGWWDKGYYDANADGWFDYEGYDVNPVDNQIDAFYPLQTPVGASVSPLVNENIMTMYLIRTQDPWAHQDPWGTWAGDASNNPLW